MSTPDVREAIPGKTVVRKEKKIVANDPRMEYKFKGYQSGVRGDLKLFS